MGQSRDFIGLVLARLPGSVNLTLLRSDSVNDLNINVSIKGVNLLGIVLFLIKLVGVLPLVPSASMQDLQHALWKVIYNLYIIHCATNTGAVVELYVSLHDM